MDINTQKYRRNSHKDFKYKKYQTHHTIPIFSTFKEIKDKLENTCGEHKTIKNNKAPIIRDK